MSANKKAIRQAFRDSVFKRDNHRCRVCSDQNSPLDAHHITDRNEMPNGGYVKENGISLCPPCHEKAEAYHSSGKTSHVDGYHPLDLYRKIGSSEEIARRASQRLG